MTRVTVTHVSIPGSNHRATLKNEHLGELIRTSSTTHCPDVRGPENQIKINADNYCTSYNVKLAFFTVFVLTLHTDFAARWYFWFPANDFH